MADAETSGAPLWVRIIAIAAGLIGGVFILWWLADSLSQSARNDAQRVRELAIAADNLASWPEVARQMGRSSLFHRGPGGHPDWRGRGKIRIRLHHPDFRDFSILYWRDGPPCTDRTEINGGKLTVWGSALSRSPDDPDEAAYVDRAIKASWIRSRGARQVCYKVGPLDLNSVVIDRGRFQHLLLVALPEARVGRDKHTVGITEGVIEAQIGDAPLPVRELSDLPKIESSLETLAIRTARETLASAAGAKLAPAPATQPRDALAPIDTSVEGKRLRFYFRPLVFGDAASPQGGKSYYLVGADPAGVQPGENMLGAQTVAFTIALGLLLALVPVIKLAKLGPVDSLKPIEVAAVVFGLVTAFALGAAGWVTIRDILVTREATSDRLAITAQTLERDLYFELLGIADSPLLRRLSDERKGGVEMVSGRFEAEPGKSYPEPDAVFLVDQNGRQPLDQTIRVARDQSGADYVVRDRNYFLRARAGEASPGSEKLLERLKWKAGGLWLRTRGGLVLDQIRSRVDGVPRTIFTASIGPPSPLCPAVRRISARLSPATLSAGAAASVPSRQGIAAINVSVVLRGMLAPTLKAGESFAIIDARDKRWPVLFHSEPGRAGAERMVEGLDAAARTRLTRLSVQPAPCDADAPSGKMQPAVHFAGEYDGAATLFAATRVRCSDWMVVTWTQRSWVDRLAVAAPVHAVLLWSGFAILFVLAWAVAATLLGDRVWCWLWPDPSTRKRQGYWAATGVMAVALALAFFILATTDLPLLSILVGVLGAGTGLAFVIFAHVWTIRASTRASTAGVADRTVSGATTDSLRRRNRVRLSRETEMAYRLFVTLLLVSLAVLPVIGLTGDARLYFAHYRAGQDLIKGQERAAEQQRMEHSVARSISVQRRSEPIPPSQPPSFADCSRDHPSDDCPGLTLTGTARAALGSDAGAVFDKPTDASGAHGRVTFWFSLIGALLALGVVGAVALRAFLRGLFGFGVALEAIDYPPLPEQKDDGGNPVVVPGKEFLLDRTRLPRRFMGIALPDAEARELIAAAKDSGYVIDLFRSADAPLASFKTPAPWGAHVPLILFRNLGTLLRDPKRRRSALRLMESFIERQEHGGEFKIGLMADLSPLDRLLHSYERETDDLRDLDPKERVAVQREWHEHREDMRWSRLFEEFTTYIYSAERRRRPARMPRASSGLRTLWNELEYIPDHAVGPLVPDPSPPLRPAEILHWARNTFRKSSMTGERPAPDAIVDYLASMLIEHYQHMWTISSRAERLLLHRFAHHHIPNLDAAYPVRTLIRRGLVVLDPYPRIMNRSFAQFVRHAEKQSTIKDWRAGSEHGMWSTLRKPLIFAVPIALLVLVYFSLRNGDSLTSLLPLVAAAGPALIQALGAGRRAVGT